MSMIGARAYRTSRRRRGGRGLSLLLALSLVLGLLGPVSGTLPLPSRDGFIPICTGSEIVYIPIAEAGLVRPAEQGQSAPATDPTTVPCPWFVPFHAVVMPSVASVHVPVAYAVPHFRLADSAPAGRFLSRSFRARAPPPAGV